VKTFSRFTVLVQGPDNNSTYSECWGSNSSSRGRHLADCASLSALIETIHDLAHTNYTVRDRTKHVTYNGPSINEIKAAEAKVA
jgi:hypothetical protein